MSRVFFCKVAVLLGSLLFKLDVSGQNGNLRVVLIRHAEKPQKGYNLTCKGLNRSLQLVSILYSRFGLPAAIYVPSLGERDSTKHARMFQTIAPFVTKYNLTIRTSFHENDTSQLAQAIRQQKGVVLVVWEHSRLPAIARCLGVKDVLHHWKDDDYDSIWIIDYVNGAAVLIKDKEGLHPGEACPVE
jgi:hypothetical protein